MGTVVILVAPTDTARPIIRTLDARRVSREAAGVVEPWVFHHRAIYSRHVTTAWARNARYVTILWPWRQCFLGRWSLSCVSKREGCCAAVVHVDGEQQLFAPFPLLVCPLSRLSSHRPEMGTLNGSCAGVHLFLRYECCSAL